METIAYEVKKMILCKQAYYIDDALELEAFSMADMERRSIRYD